MRRLLEMMETKLGRTLELERDDSNRWIIPQELADKTGLSAQQ